MSSKTQSARLHTAGRFALANPRSVSSVALAETQTRADPAVLAVAPGAPSRSRAPLACVARRG
jgi:hypothetical protein